MRGGSTSDGARTVFFAGAGALAFAFVLAGAAGFVVLPFAIFG
jgi:hypothetical protein